MEQFALFAGVFLSFSLVFLASLYLKYSKTLRERDAKQRGCPVHVNHKHKTNVAVTSSDITNKTENDIDKLCKLLNLKPDNESLINQSFEVSVQIINSLPKNVKISTEIQLKLYGLFKQSKFGDIDKEEPNKLYYAEYAKWSSWNEHKGKEQIIAKREYFDIVYAEIVKPFNLNVLLFDDMNDIPEELKQHTISQQDGGGRGGTMNFAVNSKIAEEFDEELHGDPNELFNKFDLTKNDLFNNDSDLNEIKLYIERNKININKENENGTTFLNFAVDNKKYLLSKLLIQEFNADINLSDDMGYTPLHCAAINGDEQTIKLLIQFGADINLKSYDDNETPADLADSNDIKQLLLTDESS